MPLMKPVSSAEMLAIENEVVAAACDKTCQVYRKSSVTRDVYGSQTATYSLIETTVAGMAQPSAGQLQNYDFLIGSLASWQVHLPIGIDVQPQDHLVIDGQTLEVHVVLTPESYSALLNVLAAEVKA